MRNWRPEVESQASPRPAFALAYKEPAIPETMRQLRRAMATENPVAALSEMKDLSGLPRSLAEIGMPADGVDRAVDVAFEQPYWNPRELVAHRFVILSVMRISVKGHAGESPAHWPGC